MKILQLGKFYPIRGGVEKVMWDLTRGLGEAGVECDMLCARLTGDEPDFKDRGLVEESLPDGCPEGTLLFRLSPCSRVFCVPAKKKVAATMICPEMTRFLKRHRGEYDVVHIHHPDPMAALALFLSGYRGKVVLHWHSDILKQKTLLKFYRPLQSWMIRRADRIVGTSPVYVKESPYLQNVQDKVSFLPIGVDSKVEELRSCESFLRKVRSYRNRYPGKKIVFSLGRLVGYKGYDHLVEAASYLPDDYQVVIGGKGPLRADLEDTAARLGVSGKVDFVGWLPDDDAEVWFDACDLFALSSVWKTEAFAIVQVEAMRAGKPVVATRIPGSGVSWVNADGTSGLNVPVEDGRALADAILKICSDRNTYSTFCEGARRRYEEMFTYDRMIQGATDIYESL